MADRGDARLVQTPGRPSLTPISVAQIETVVSRSVAAFGVLFLAQSIPSLLSQFHLLQPLWGWFFVVANVGGVFAVVVASVIKRFVGPVTAFVSFAYLVSLAAWPFIQNDPGAVADGRPWLWLICTVATTCAAIAFGTVPATVYLVVTPIVYGVVRATPSGGGVDAATASLDVAYAMILGGAVLILITVLRQAAASVDTAQITALDRYSHAVRQHAMESERVQVDAIVHDSVLTTFLSAASARTPAEKQLAARMAESAIGHLADAATVVPDDGSSVPTSTLAQRVVGAMWAQPAQFALRMHRVGDGELPVPAAEALYSAAVQAMVNSQQHAGEGVDRWLAVESAEGDGIRITVGDSGRGFDVDQVPTERLGVRISIIERVAKSGGSAEVISTPGGGTVVRMCWPGPDAVDPSLRYLEGTA